MTSQSSPVPRLEAFAPGAALVTGAAGGIGLALSRALAQAGMAVAMADIDEDSLGARAQELQSHGHRVLALRLDVTDRAACEQAADRVEEDLGPLHVLCNNAGLSALGMTVADMDDAYWDLTMRVNLDSVFAGSRVAARRMAARGRGHLVNTASISALGLCSAGTAAYAASKYAVMGLSEVLRQELAPQGVGVSVLCPGPVRTNLWKSTRRLRGLPELDMPPADSLRGSASPTALDPDLGVSSFSVQ